MQDGDSVDISLREDGTPLLVYVPSKVPCEVRGQNRECGVGEERDGRRENGMGIHETGTLRRRLVSAPVLCESNRYLRPCGRYLRPCGRVKAHAGHNMIPKTWAGFHASVYAAAC